MKRAFVIGAILQLLFASTLHGALVAQIIAPDKAEVGDLVVLEAKAEGATNFAWTLGNSSKAFLPVEHGLKAVFASGQAGEYIFVLAASSADELSITKHSVIIGEAPKPIPPSPPTPPTPTPLPPGKYDLANLARTWATSISDPSNAKVLAGSFRRIVSSITDGKLIDGRTILTETRKSNQASLSLADRTKWLPFFQSLQLKLDAWIESKTLVTPADYKTAWEEIVLGLEAVQ